jgi:hypothetical protein
MIDAHYLIEKADLCFGLSRLAGENRELAKALAKFGDELMAKAVELDTERDRAAPVVPAPTNKRRYGR